MLTLAAWFSLLAIMVPNVVIAVELLAGIRPRALPRSEGASPDTVVLMPAHDEAAGIAAVLDRVLMLLPSGMRLLVVADNCSDDTAALVRAAGVDVTERHDPTRRGKGHALAHGRAHLADRPPAVVIVLDADCVPEPGALERLAWSAAATGRTVQATYLLEPRPSASPMIQISGFAFLVKNLVRQAGLARIGAPAVLTGSGMAFPWSYFAVAPLATDDIVEDLAIGIALARAGSPPRFDPAARIWTAPAGSGGTLGQRTRWEHGFARTARRVALPLVAEGLRRGRPGLAWLGLHVAVPPLALLLGIDGAALLASTIAWAFGASIVPLLIGLTLVGLVLLGVFVAWGRHGRDQVSGGALARAPIYLLWKLPIYLKLVRRAETRWVRTDRS
ncbi:glycosyltransferase family 2 protein [uncultured Sphingomonas sp.]|uniref:glycosyltransferase family 2 protein n=1 Tax=uncultured Sphingomonas sp. TaxID=158754 RepID=UPI0035CA8F09